MEAILLSALAGAVGGAVGAGLSWVIGRGRDPQPKWLIILPIACAAFAISMARGAQGNDAGHLMAEMDGGQNISLLKTYYPDDYAKLVREVGALPSSADRRALAAVVDRVLGEVINRQRLKADDETSRQMYAAARDEAAALKTLSPAACAAFMDGAGRAEDLAKVMTPKLREQDVAVTRRLLTQTATKPAPPATPMPVEALGALSLPALSKFSEAEQTLVIQMLREGRSPSSAEEHRLMCDFSLAQADEILAAPPPVAGARVRALWALNAGGSP